MAGMDDLTIVSFLKTKMKWHQTRQKLLSENVANADTPGFRPKDLKPLTFKDALGQQHLKTTGVSMERTHPDHIGGPARDPVGFKDKKSVDFEVTPEGNGVVLEDQMLKVSENAFDYQMASTLYSRSIGLIRTALGRT